MTSSRSSAPFRRGGSCRSSSHPTSSGRRRPSPRRSSRSLLRRSHQRPLPGPGERAGSWRNPDGRGCPKRARDPPVHRRGLPVHERARHQPGHFRQHLRALGRRAPAHPVRAALQPDDAGRHRPPAHGRNLRPPADAVLRVALPPRHHEEPQGRRRHRPRPPDLLHGLRDVRQGHPGGPLHDRGGGRPDGALRPLRHLRHAGALGGRARRRWRAAPAAFSPTTA